MSFLYRRGQFRAADLIVAPGDVHHWRHQGADHGKFHLCISWDCEFLYLNKPKDREYEGDVPIQADDVRFLKPRPERLSFVSCHPIIVLEGAREVARVTDGLVGNIATGVLIGILRKVRAARTTEPRDARRLLDVIADLERHIPPPPGGRPGSRPRGPSPR